jgi:hypothetical protein
MPTISIGLSGEEAIRRLIPEHCREGLMLYIMEGIEPGGFLCAVLENDLIGAFSKADSINSARMEDYAKFLHNYAPRECHGSPLKVRAWCQKGGLNGMEKAKQYEKIGEDPYTY